MPAFLDLPPQAALEFELASITAFDGMLRQLQAEQYRRIQRALDHTAVIEGVGESSTAGERDMASRSFVAELATLLGQHEASASRLVAEAARLTGPRRATLAALEAGELSLTQVRSVLELTQGLPAEVADAVESVAVDAAAAAGARGGTALSYGREHYRAPADLDGFVRVRDGQCRFPGCSRRAERADLDHTVDWAHGGATSAANLAVLCRHHHRLKHESGWRVAQEPGGVMRWTSPIGHVLRTLPERPFVPVGGGEGVDPIGDARSSDPPSPPPERADPIDDELRCLLEHDAEPAPF